MMMRAMEERGGRSDSLTACYIGAEEVQRAMYEWEQGGGKKEERGTR